MENHGRRMNETLSAVPLADDETPEFLAVEGEMAAMMRARDWTRTELGPPQHWPQSLKTVVRIMLTSRYAMWMGWGDKLRFFYNDAYRPTLGVKHGWALGAPATEVWAEIWGDIGPLIDEVLRTGRATWSEGRLLFLERSGYPEETYHTFSYSPLADDSGATAGMFCVVTEETERIIGARRLASLRDLAAGLAGARAEAEVLDAVQAVLHSADKDLPFALLYLFDVDGQARLVRTAGIGRDHPAAVPVFGDGGPWPASAIDQPLAPVIGDLAACCGAPLPTGAWARAPQQSVMVPIAVQGQVKPAGYLVAGLSPHRPYDASYGGFLSLMAGQISAGLAGARGYEAERRRAEALAELDRAKTRFFSNVSHEFRTPLTLMMSPIEEALARPDTEPLGASRPLLDVAHRNSLRLLRLVNALLDFSRVEAGRVQASYAPTDLAALTADLASNFRSACEKAGLVLTVDCPPLSEPVYVDREMWEKIVLNLVSNAFKFTRAGGIAVALREGRGSALLSVCDTGVGIPPDDLPRVFERFHRVDGQQGRTHEGTGIGLALVQELVKLHGGAARVESRVGEGATFTIELPLGTAHLPTDRIGGHRPAISTATGATAFVEEALRWLPGEGEKTQDATNALSDTEPSISARDAAHLASRAARARVVLADDNADMRDYVGRLLREVCDVETVGDGAAALEAARRCRPDLVLSDVMMPKLDGFGLVRELRADAKLRTVPVILLSARAGEAAEVEGLEAGADDYLVKPFSARELVARIRTNLDMARIRQDAAEALRARTAELEAVLETVPVAVYFTKDPGATEVWGNCEANRLLGLEAGANPSLTAAEEERPANFRIWNHRTEIAPENMPLQRAARGEEVSGEELEIRFTDGRSKWIVGHARPLRDDSGRVIGAVAAAADVTERKRAEEQRTLLINELNHRVKNTLATVQSIAAQTLRGADVEPALREAFEARLLLLASAHDVLTLENWHDAALRDIVAKALGPFQSLDRRFDVEGPDVRLSPKAALAIAMALHELATNAAKYGALSNGAGTVSVVWATAGDHHDRHLLLNWVEHGGPRVQPPRRKGFGSRLIERGLARELGGRAHIDYLETGVICTIVAPLSHYQGDSPSGAAAAAESLAPP